MTMFSSWKRFDFDKIAPAQALEQAGWVRKSPSPYDVPTHGRAKVEEIDGVLVIQFKYISDEPVSTVRLNDYLDASIGKTTRRIFEIRFRAREYHRAKGKSPLLDSREMVETLSSSRTSNGVIASRAVDQNKNDLFTLAAVL